MNAINRAVTSFFDLVLTPLEAVSDEFALLFVSGVFGVLALWIFKHISWQKGIKATKDKIKGHLIEIRLYQDDLVTVGKAIGKVLFRNVQYLVLNFGPFVPLAIPFALVAAQMVVRYGFEPVPDPAGRTSSCLAGRRPDPRGRGGPRRDRRPGDRVPRGPRRPSRRSPASRARAAPSSSSSPSSPGSTSIVLTAGGKSIVKVDRRRGRGQRPVHAA